MKKFRAVSFVVLLAGASTAQVTLTGPGDVPCPSLNTTAVIRQKVCMKPTWCETTRTISRAWASRPYLGGAAWDLRSGKYGWYSNGPKIYVTVPDPLGCKSCKIICVLDWDKLWGKKYGMITGLAYLDVGFKAPYLFIATTGTSSGPYIVRARIFSPCKIAVDLACGLHWGANHYIGGLTADPVTKRIFYTYTHTWSSFTQNVLMVAPYNKPCNYDCKYNIPLKPCLGGPITGAAFNIKTRSVYLTIGKITQTFHWDNKCAFKPGKCCSAAPTLYRGLTMIPGCPYGKPGTFSVRGKNTYTRTPICNFKCPYCKSVPGYEGGLPQVGNTNFKLTVTQSAVNTPNWIAKDFVILNFVGGWMNFTINMPCGPVVLYPAIQPPFFQVFGPFSPVGTIQCKGKATMPLAIPCNPALVGSKVSGQWAVTTYHLKRRELCIELTPGFMMTF